MRHHFVTGALLSRHFPRQGTSLLESCLARRSFRFLFLVLGAAFSPPLASVVYTGERKH